MSGLQCPEFGQSNLDSHELFRHVCEMGSPGEVSERLGATPRHTMWEVQTICVGYPESLYRGPPFPSGGSTWGEGWRLRDLA